MKPKGGDSVELGEKIRALRSEQGLTQEDVARSLNITRQAVARWEAGTNRPSTEKLLALAGLFGVPVSELAGGEPEAPAPLPRELVLDIAKVAAAYALLWVICTLGAERIVTPVIAPIGVWYWCSRHFVLPLCFLFSALAWAGGLVRLAVSAFIGLVSGIILASVWDAAVWPGPAGVSTGFVVVIAAAALSVSAGAALEFRAGEFAADRGGLRLKPRVALVLLLLLLLVLSAAHITNRLSYISGANDGWERGFDDGLADARAGEEYCSSYSAAPGGFDQYYLGWQSYYGSGYAKGWESGIE